MRSDTGSHGGFEKRGLLSVLPELVSYVPDLKHPPKNIAFICEPRENDGIGGKAKGLFFAAHLQERGVKLAGEYSDLVKIPKTFIIPTSTFDDFTEYNDINVRMKGRDYEETQRIFLEAEFPDYAHDNFVKFLSAAKKPRPLTTRSTTLQEDSLKHAFAGLFLTLFIPNNGSVKKRLEEFETAVKLVYASTFNPNAVAYREKHGLKTDEDKMAVVVQKIVGEQHGDYYYPFVAGVAFSRNEYPWSSRVKIEEGVVRVVYGLGTRAVGREHARRFVPSNPGIRPEGGEPKAVMKYAQERFDALNMTTGGFETRYFNDF
ncbi:MAG: PEP/pyruvate-binding domain-containing protein, partial [Candidatus Micrarchaeota archaeon]